MNLKPLIKTHWLASQNPMTVSLAGLKSVVFNPSKSVLNAEFQGAPEARVDLAPLNEVQILSASSDELQDIRARSHSLSRDLFWTLFAGVDLPAFRLPPAALRALAQSLEFHFVDGTVLSAVGICRRPDFPVFLSPKFYLQDRSCNWSRVFENPSWDQMGPLKVYEVQKKNEDFKRTWGLILEILAWALQRKRQIGDLEVLFSSSDISRAAYPITDVEFHKAHPLAATVMSDLTVANTAHVKIWQGLEPVEKPGVLRLHKVDFVSDFSEHGLPIEILPKEIQTLNSALGSQNWQPCLSTPVVGATEINKAIAQLEKTVSRDRILFVDHTWVLAPDFKPCLKIRESEGSLQTAVLFDLPTLELQQLNFPPGLWPALAPFRGGLDVFFAVDRKDVASKRSLHRASDLLLLRHQGVTLFTLMELVNWRLDRPLSSGEKIEFFADLDSPEAGKSFDQVVDYLKNSIPGLLGQPGAVFNEMFSSEVKSLFMDFVEKIFQALSQDRYFIFHGTRVGEIKNVQKQVLPLLRFLILHFIEETRGKFLTRSQAPLSPAFKEHLRLWTEPLFIPQTLKGQIEPRWVDIGLYGKHIISLLFDLLEMGIEVEFNGQPFLNQDNPFEFIFSVSNTEQGEASNLFDLHPKIFFNGERVNADEVRLNFTPDQTGFIEFRGQVYRIDKKQVPTLKSLQKFWNRIRGEHLVVRRNSFGDKVYRLDRSQALELLMLKSQGIHVEGEGAWKQIFEYFETGLGVEKISLPPAMLKILLPHQQEGAQWLYDLYKLRLGAILADEMGLGKTFQVLSFFTSLQKSQELKKCLVVVPTSLVYNWMEEKNKFAADLPVRVFQSNEKDKIAIELEKPDPLILVSTYGLLNENSDFFQAHEWNVVVFDEAQNLKNITSLRSVCARKLKSVFKVCLTGTPMENHYLEFYSLCDLVVPGCLGDVDSFRKKYYNDEVRNESLRDLRLISKPLLLRRTKDQVKLSLPSKTLQKVLLPFEEKQKEIYKKMAMTFSRQVSDLIQQQGEKKAQIAMFSALMRLRQICSDPAAVPGVVYEEKPVKVEHLLSSIQDHIESQESVIIFTQFLSTLGRLERELKKINVPVFILQGSVSAKERLKIISAFQNSPEPGIMLMTLKTGGVGLNLTKASVVYHLEPWWNPAVENQATDRAHRMGQTKDVKVYNLLIEGSLEERIADLKIRKQDSFDRLFNVDEEDSNGLVTETSSGLSREDFIHLLK